MAIPSDKKTILAVDDSPENLILICGLLRDDYQVKVAIDGENALRIAHAQPPPDLILLDIMMPKMDGYTVCRHLKADAQTCAIPVLFLSALTDVECESRGFELGAEDFISKPINPEIVKHRISKQLELKAHREQLQSLVDQKTSELKSAYQDLHNLHQQVLQQQKLATLGQLAAGVAHEINTPIGYVTSNLNTLKVYVGKIMAGCDRLEQHLKDDPDSGCFAQWQQQKRVLKFDHALADLPDLIDESLCGIDSISKIVLSLKGFSRVEHVSDRVAVDLHQLLESALKIAWNDLKYKAQIVKNYSDLPMVECLPQQISQVFINLLMNAAQAIDKNGVITISTQCQRGFAVVKISDNGCGFSPQLHELIFKPFFTTKQVGVGTGLGLSICHDIIKQHNGLIAVESQPTLGSCFSVSLPLKPFFNNLTQAGGE